MKRILSLFMAVAMLLSMCTVASATETITINAMTFVAANQRDYNPSYNIGTYVDIFPNSSGAGYVEYEVDVSEAGMYQLRLRQRYAPYRVDEADPILNVYVGNFLVGSKDYTGLTQEWNWTTHDICEIPLNEGTNRIKLELPLAGELWIKEFTLERTGDLIDVPVVVAPITVNALTFVAANHREATGYVDIFPNSSGAGYVEYEVEALTAGMYQLSVSQKFIPYYAKNMPAILCVYVDNLLAGGKDYTGLTQEWGWTSHDICEIPLNEGTNRIKLEMPSDGELFIKEFTLERTGDLPEAPTPTTLHYAYNTHADRIAVYGNESNGNNAAGMWNRLNADGSAFFTTDAAPGTYRVTAKVAAIEADKLKVTGYLAAENNDFSSPFVKGAVTFPNGLWFTCSELDIGAITITGEKKIIGIKFTETFGRLESITLTPVELDMDSTYAIGGVAYNESTLYSRGSDVIEVTYTGDIAIDSNTKATITAGDGEIIATEARVDSGNSKKLIVAFKNSLSLDKTYTLTLENVINSGLGLCMSDETISFSTKADNDALVSGSAEITEFTIDQGIANIKGTVKGSSGLGISGRKISWYLTLPGGSETLVNDTAVSGENGAFELSYTLPYDNIKGDVTAKISAEYISSVTESYYYVSDTYLVPILASLESTTTWQEVQSIFVDNGTDLGLDIAADLAGLTQQGFYEQFIGADINSADEFRNLYHSMIVVEKINQAASVANVSMLNAETLALFETDTIELTDKYALFEDVLNANQATFYTELFNADRIMGKDGFVAAFDNAFNEALIEYAGLSDITITADTASAKVGAALELDVIAASAFNKVKKCKITITFAGALDGTTVNVDFTSTLGTVTKVESVTRTASPNEVIYEIDVTDSEALTDNIGKLSFANGAAGSGTVTIKGEAISDTGIEYDATVLFNPIVMDVTVNAQESRPVVSGGGSPSVSRDEKPVMKDPIVPEDAKEEEIKEEEVVVFSDLAGYDWAKESIMGLYKLHAINDGDNGKFNPSRNVTRAEFVKMVVISNYLGYADSPDFAHPKMKFTDVTSDAWYYQYLQAAVHNGLITGDSDGKFRANDYITRQDICTILARLTMSSIENPSDLFVDDNSISDYARGAVYAMKSKGIVNGIGDNKFAPKAYATRAEAAKIIFGASK